MRLGQNGYIKFTDGLLLQYGYATSNQDINHKQTVYMPMSYYNGASYAVIPVARSSHQDYYVGKTVAALDAGSFILSSNQQNKEPFYWFAIGSWK